MGSEAIVAVVDTDLDYSDYIECFVCLGIQGLFDYFADSFGAFVVAPAGNIASENYVYFVGLTDKTCCWMNLV